jgi:predicted dehydrogenase
MSGKKINAAVVGFGLSGRVFHAPFLFTNPRFELKMIVERHTNSSKKIYPDIKIVRDYKELLNDPEIDLIVVGTPNITHFEMVKDCLEAGKQVVVEKPFTATSLEADELIKISEKVNKKIFVYHNRRWDGDFLTIKKLLAENKLGEVLEYEAHFDRFSPEIPEFAWRDEPLPGSGILYDLGSHLIDQATLLFGLPESVFADIRKQRAGSMVDDYFDLHLYYNRLKVILKAGMFVKDPGPRFTINGTKGSFVKYGIDPQEANLKAGMMPEGEEWGKEIPEFWGFLNTEFDGFSHKKMVETEPGNYHGFYDNVYDVLINNGEMNVKPVDARNVIRIIELAFESADKKKIVNFME